MERYLSEVGQGQRSAAEEPLNDSYDQAARQKIIDTQSRMVKLAKLQGYKRMPSICVLLDAMLDDKRLMTSNGSESKA